MAIAVSGGHFWFRFHSEPEFARSGQSLRNWVRRQLRRTPAIHRRQLTAEARRVGYVPQDGRGSEWINGTLYYLAYRGEIEIRNGVVHAVALAHRLYTTDAFKLSKMARNRLRGKSVVSRAELRVDLREARLLAGGVLGARRLREVLKEMEHSGEILLTPTDIVVVNLRPPTKERKLHLPPSALVKKRLSAEKRAVRAAERKAAAGLSA